MAENSGGGNALMGVIIGAVLVVAVVAGIFAYTGGNLGGRSMDVNVEVPDAPTPS